MGMEKIGLEGVFQTTAFAAGLKTYMGGLGSATNKTVETGMNMGKALSSGVISIVGGFAAIAAAAAASAIAVGTAITKMVMDATKMADALASTSEQTGINVTRLQELAFAGKSLDVEATTITNAYRKLTIGMYAARDGESASADGFKELGVDIFDTNGELRNSDAVFADVIDGLRKIKNPTVRDAMAMKLLGKSAMELNPLINAGSVEFERLAQKAYEMGAIMSEDDVKALDSFGDQLDTIKLTLQTTTAKVATAFLPAFQGIADLFTGVLSDPKTQEWLKLLTDSISTFVTILMGGGSLNYALTSFSSLVGTLPTIGEILIGAFDTGVDMSQKFKDWIDGIDWEKLSTDLADGISAIDWSTLGAQFTTIAKNIGTAILIAISEIQWKELGISIGTGFGDFIVGAMTDGGTLNEKVQVVWEDALYMAASDIQTHGSKAWVTALAQVMFEPFASFIMQAGVDMEVWGGQMVTRMGQIATNMIIAFRNAFAVQWIRFADWFSMMVYNMMKVAIELMNVMLPAGGKLTVPAPPKPATSITPWAYTSVTPFSLPGSTVGSRTAAGQASQSNSALTVNIYGQTPVTVKDITNALNNQRILEGE